MPHRAPRLGLDRDTKVRSVEAPRRPRRLDRGQENADADEDDDPLTTLRRDLAATRKRILLAPTTAAGHGAGSGAAPSKDYKSEGFGCAPPETVVEARRDLERSILAACGVPPVLANHATPGTSMRKA